MQCSDNDVKFSDGGVVLLCCHVTCSGVPCVVGWGQTTPEIIECLVLILASSSRVCSD